MIEELPGFIPQVMRRDDVSLLRADETVLNAMVDGWRAQRLSPLKRHRDESWVQFACGTGGSGGRGKVCGRGSHLVLDTTVRALRHRDGQRRQNHLGEGPTEEVPPARAAKRSGPTDQ